MMRPERRYQRGVGLIEVLVSVAVVSIGLLGVAALQTAALRSNQSSNERVNGVIAAYSILEAMRANRTVAAAGNYNLAFNETPGNGSSVAEKDLRWWRDQLAAGLNGGTGAVDCASAAPVCIVTVRWNDSRVEGGSSAETLVIRSRLE